MAKQKNAGRARKKAQNEQLELMREELAAARDRYSQLFELSPVPCLTVTPSGLVQEINKPALAFLGVEPAVILDRPLTLFVAVRDRADFRRRFARCRALADTEAIETRMRARGIDVPVEVVVRPTAGGLVYIALVDLSERRRMESERARMKVDAEIRRKASEAKDHFLATLSHELRTPLTPVLAVISGLEPRLVRGDIELPEVCRLLALVRRYLGYEVRLIDDLLDLTRIGRGRLRLEKADVDLHLVVREAVALLSEEAADKDIRIDLNLTASRSQVHGDPGRLRQVFWNLLRNAVKFSSSGETIIVSSREEDRWLAVEVFDRGLGIPQEDLERIFNPFEQSDGGAQAGGLGLGLAIVREVIQEHGGRIGVASAGRWHGTVFTVHLELASILEPLPAPAARPRSRRAEARPAGGRILLVEDHRETAEVLSTMLAAEGYEVAVARSITEAVTAARGRPIDLVISDLGLPDGSGLDLLAQLGDRRPTAIALSGYGQPEDLERTRAAGFSAHLVKPVEFPHLLGEIRRLVGAARPLTVAPNSSLLLSTSAGEGGRPEKSAEK